MPDDPYTPRPNNFLEIVKEHKRLEELAAADGRGPAPPRLPRTGSTRRAEEFEPWAQRAIDAEIDAVESDPEKTRNDRLNSRALRCFRLAMLAGYDLDSVYNALFAAAQVAGRTGSHPHTDSQIENTLNSALKGAHKHGPADPPDDLDHVEEVSAEELGARPTVSLPPFGWLLSRMGYRDSSAGRQASPRPGAGVVPGAGVI